MTKRRKVCFTLFYLFLYSFCFFGWVGGVMFKKTDSGTNSVRTKCELAESLEAWLSQVLTLTLFFHGPYEYDLKN